MQSAEVGQAFNFRFGQVPDGDSATEPMLLNLWDGRYEEDFTELG